MMMTNFFPGLWFVLQLGRTPANVYPNPLSPRGVMHPDPASLHLMSDIVGGSADFDPVPQLGYSFVCADTNGISTQDDVHQHVNEEKLDAHSLGICTWTG